MTPGRLWYLIRRCLREGWLVPYYRNVVRPRILETRPVAGTTDGCCEIHALTSEEDWLNLMWALKSFYSVTGRRYSLCIHDDGTLAEEAIAALRAHFPDARVVTRSGADLAVMPALEGRPRAHRFREGNRLALKIIDFREYLGSDRMLLLDSDVLFFEEPKELIRRIEDAGYGRNSVNADVASAYTVDPTVARADAGVELEARFNSGLGLIHGCSMDPGWIEEFLGLAGVMEGHFWRIEQTLFALCSSRFGVELLPPEYDVRLTGGIDGSPCRHYVGAIRHLFYREGMRVLARGRLLERLG